MKFSLVLSLLFVTALANLSAQSPALALHDHSEPTAVTSESAAPVPYLVASFPGGEAELLRHVQHKLTYPEIAQQYGVEGTVVIRLDLDRAGKIRERTLIKGLGFGCDAAALAALADLPDWNPARHYGRGVKSVVFVPLRFRLQ